MPIDEPPRQAAQVTGTRVLEPVEGRARMFQRSSDLPAFVGAGADCERLREHVERLPQAYQQVFLLRDVERMSVADMARTLEVPLSIVRMRLHRSREELRKRLRAPAEP